MECTVVQTTADVRCHSQISCFSEAISMYFRFTSAILFFSRWSLSICRAYTSFALGAPKIYSRWNFTNSLFLTEGFTISGLIGAILDSRMSVYDNTSAYPSWNYEQNTYGYTKTYTCSKLIDIAHLWATFFRNQLTSINHANNIFRSGAHEDMKLVDENVCCF